jgi:2-C-methyl-D-erythritol 4-phosphate cytidylyltransferase / 2-C-methyl-D-erythritol 2,4-cyclodiphosphate synthase
MYLEVEHLSPDNLQLYLDGDIYPAALAIAGTRVLLANVSPQSACGPLLRVVRDLPPMAGTRVLLAGSLPGMEGRFADSVIVAAGSSSRMGGVDKLAEPLLDRPLLAWSVEAMARAESVNTVVLVARTDQVDALRSAEWLASAGRGRVQVVAGGEQRSDSVRAGVAATDASVVLVHDGARPLASSQLADAVAFAAAEHGAAIPAVPVVDSLKRARGDNIEYSVDRESLVRAQTPQGARRDNLMSAFEAAAGSSYTDEAALLEAAGITVATVPGEAINIKVTDAADLEIVRAIAAARSGDGAATSQSTRLGFGEDTHGFGPEDGLMLGGVLVAEAPRLYGHSDGDVVLHALATAILSATGLGDLGRLFPPNDPQTSGIASGAMLVEALDRAEAAGWGVDRTQISIVGSRPRLGGHRLDEMQAKIAALIGTEAGSVAVTASTGNLTGPEGAGRSIRATALVTVIRR